MRRMFLLGLAMVMICVPALSFGAEAEVYETVVPLRDSEIQEVNDNYFVEKTQDNGWQLIALDGEILLTGEERIQLSPWSAEYIMVRRDGRWGVCTPKGRMLVPCQYDEIAVKGTECAGLTAVLDRDSRTENITIIDLRTGDSVQEIGDVSPNFLLAWQSGDWDVLPGEMPTRFQFSEYRDDSTYTRQISVTNGDGQLLLRQPETLTIRTRSQLKASAADSFLEGYNDDVVDRIMFTREYFIYSDRGRLLYRSEKELSGIPGGEYFIEGREAVRNRDGELVIPAGKFSAIRPGQEWIADVDHPVNRSQRLLIVQKDGKCGVIRLPAYEAKPSVRTELFAASARQASIVSIFIGLTRSGGWTFF